MRFGEMLADWRNAMRLGAMFPLAVAALLAIPAGPSRADEFSPEQKKAIEGIVHDYLLQHPEVLIEAVQSADDKMKADAHDKATKVLADRSDAKVSRMSGFADV